MHYINEEEIRRKRNKPSCWFCLRWRRLVVGVVVDDDGEDGRMKEREKRKRVKRKREANKRVEVKTGTFLWNFFIVVLMQQCDSDSNYDI